MELVIEIPEVFYEVLRKTDEIISGQRSGKTLMSVIYNAVAKGTPLPEEHGDLIDRGELEADAEWNDRYENYTAFSSGQIVNAPAIIKAEKESERV